MSDTLRKDILVVGGGTAGCAAAIASARRGHSVLLVEDIRDISIAQLRAELAASGVELDPARHKSFAVISEEEISDRSSRL